MSHEEAEKLQKNWPDLFVVPQFFEPRLCAAIVDELKAAAGSAASRESQSPEPDAFCGGLLVFSDLRNSFRMPAEPGTLVAFRSETTHEVTPVTHGERYSIASWYR